MKTLLIASLLLLSTNIFSQAQTESLDTHAKEIDEQIWEPFKKAYASNDGSLYNSLHTDDVLRVTEGGIRQGDVYKKKNLESFAKKDRRPRLIDFRFEHRIHADSIGYEVGYYRIVRSLPKYEEQLSFGRFHVVLKKINGIWKIAQDWDTSNVNGVTVTAADWEKLGQ